MTDLLNNDASLSEQLKLLESLYANCRIDKADPKTLFYIWNQITELRQKLGIAFYQ